MNAEQFQMFKEQVIAAVEAHLANGGQIRSGLFGAPTGRYDCVLLSYWLLGS
jgi:hypothetical protein